MFVFELIEFELFEEFDCFYGVFVEIVVVECGEWLCEGNVFKMVLYMVKDLMWVDWDWLYLRGEMVFL